MTEREAVEEIERLALQGLEAITRGLGSLDRRLARAVRLLERDQATAALELLRVTRAEVRAALAQLPAQLSPEGPQEAK